MTLGGLSGRAGELEIATVNPQGWVLDVLFFGQRFDTIACSDLWTSLLTVYCDLLVWVVCPGCLICLTCTMTVCPGPLM